MFLAKPPARTFKDAMTGASGCPRVPGPMSKSAAGASMPPQGSAS